MSNEKTIFFLRHGQSEANVRRGLGEKIRDPALTELGRLQASLWGPHSHTLGVETILVSPLVRTLETASLAFPQGRYFVIARSLREHDWHDPQNQGSPYPVLLERLGELGVDRGKLRGLERLEEAHDFWAPDQEADLTIEELSLRRQAATRHLERQIFNRPERRLCLVCHYVTISHFVCARPHNCEIVRAVFKQRRNGWDVTEINLLELPAGAEGPGPAPLESHRRPFFHEGHPSGHGDSDNEDRPTPGGKQQAAMKSTPVNRFTTPSRDARSPKFAMDEVEGDSLADPDGKAERRRIRAETEDPGAARRRAAARATEEESKSRSLLTEEESMGLLGSTTLSGVVSKRISAEDRAEEARRRAALRRPAAEEGDEPSSPCSPILLPRRDSPSDTMVSICGSPRSQCDPDDDEMPNSLEMNERSSGNTLFSEVYDSDNEEARAAADESSDSAESYLLRSVGDVPPRVQEIYNTAKCKHASVLVVGWSRWHREYVALLGGGPAEPFYRYNTFSGKLDGNSYRKRGGGAHKQKERRYPHLGVLREFAEEFLALTGSKARRAARMIWQVAGEKLIGGVPIKLKQHLVFIVPAEAVLSALNNGREHMDICKYWTGQPGSCRKGDKCNDVHVPLLPSQNKLLERRLEGIDALVQLFRPNIEVCEVKLFPLKSLLTCTKPDVTEAAPVIPTWACMHRGHPMIYTRFDQGHLESAYSVGSDREVLVRGGTAMVSPVRLTHWEGGQTYEVERWEKVALRRPLLGPHGSLKVCELVLQAIVDGKLLKR